MSRRHALVVHTRMPAFDRDAGSQAIDDAIRFLREAGWDVTFMSQEEEEVAERRHLDRLRRSGVATYAGFGWAERVLRSNDFDLALVAFWDLAERLLPIVRRHSPQTRVVVDSIDLHFLRNARRGFSHAQQLGDAYGSEVARELNTYFAADAVLTVSEKEGVLLRDFLGEERVYVVPLAERVERSRVPLDERRGMVFVGNFRHLPNREAVEYLCREIVPMLAPALLDEHPLIVIGNWLEHARLRVDREMPGLELVGWVPSVAPYLERARAAAVPLLHGAGVKGKVIQAMMGYTPVVTTPVGAEGLDLVQGEHALVASDTADLAAAITRILTDDELWHRLASQGAAHVDDRHGIEVVRARFLESVERVMARPSRAALVQNAGPGFRRVSAHELAHHVRSRVQTLAEPGAVVLVASGGRDVLVELPPQTAWHFPQGADGGWLGRDPTDGPAAVNHLEAQRVRGARYFVLPRSAFAWRHRYPELHEHLERTYRLIHEDEHLVVYDLAGLPDGRASLDPVPPARVVVLGTYSAHRTGPPPALVAELGASDRLKVEQRWVPDTEPPAFDVGPEDADFVVRVRDDAILPSRFLDELVAMQRTLGADRLQPAHRGGPASGPPITERQRGTVAREVDSVTPLPVLSVRAGAPLSGPVVLADDVPVGLRDRIEPSSGDAATYVRRIWIRGADGRPVAITREERDVTPRISVLVATHDRRDLLAECLRSFAEQTLPRDEYEVVVVDDGSRESCVDELVDELSDRIEIVGVRIPHSGRSAAKNLAVMLARAPIVLFFDDDDRAAPDYLEQHLRSHEAHPQEPVAILGHTDWAPEIGSTPLMRYVTDVDRLMFAYERLSDGQELDWRGFWEGRISCKRSFLMRHALHDQRINYSIDVEMGWRLAPHGLRVLYVAGARSVMARPLDLDTFCARTEAKGRAHAVIASLHPGTEIAGRLGLDRAGELWERAAGSEEPLRNKVRALEAASKTSPRGITELHDAYRELFHILHAKGVATAAGAGEAPSARRSAVTVAPFVHDPDFAYDATPEAVRGDPTISVTIPVWSRTPALAEMARTTIERVWEVARLPTEVVVIDNGSPVETELPAKVYRYDENRGVATGWNTGIRLSTAPVVVVLNSDCRVEPGWDEALHAAVTSGRRVAFPYTDHCDGRGFVQPDQGGTAGWCFAMPRALYEEVGPFDEWFSPAFGEDTDYWHRCWEVGIELTPVPAARVVHARRTTASKEPRVDWLLQGHRYKYGWKHGVDPHRAPPYYNREIVEYHVREG